LLNFSQRVHQPLCDIIVLTYNKLELTKKFIESLLAHTRTVCQVICIDNGSSDGTRQYLSALQDTEIVRFKVILNEDNRGFVRGMNQGINLTRAPYICFSNNDLIVTEGWLEEVVDTFVRYPDVGLLNPASNNLNIHPNKTQSIEALAVELKNRYDKGSVVEMPFCIGFCMFVKREVIERIGGLSEEFEPMFFEDSDYSRRVHQAGYRVGQAQRSYVWHHEHASISQLGGQAEIFFKKSKEIFLNKWGKTLRVAWVVNGNEELLQELPKGVALGREANFVWFFVKKLTKKRTDLFKEINLPQFADVKFIRCDYNCVILYKILTKKKKYDLIITSNKMLKRILKFLGYNTSDQYDFHKIQQLKFEGQWD